MKKLIIASISVLSLIACQEKSDDKPGSFQDRVPEKLNFTAPDQGEMPTEAQINEIKATFSNQNRMELPPGELISPSSEMSAEEISKKEADLQKEDPNSYKMLKEIQAHCNVPKTTVNSTFPKESENYKPKAGDVFSMEAKQNITEKSGSCPMTSKVDMSGKIVVETYEEGQNVVKKAGATAGGNAKIEFLIKKPEYQKLLNARGMIVDTNISGLASIIDTSANKAYVTGNMTGSYITLDKQVDYSTSMELATKGKSEKEQRNQVISKAELKYPSFRVSIVFHSITENGKQLVNEVYLNGNKLNTNQQQKILNREVPGIGVVDNSPILNALK
ncbi:MAG: hypothetical protein JNM24_00580 [Bdellovibrionaceae bacterium]|nr:hypothetical protein [Pseudobdellovibrionaceae bacterium]